MFPSLSALAGAALLVNYAAAQVSTACQPLNTTNCPADPAFGTDYLFNFNVTPSSTFWETTAGSVQYTNESGAAFVINKQGDSPTIRTNFYIFFGRTEMMIKAASGTGIISSVMFLSDDLDEIDWEFMGGNSTHVETNYFGKGRQDYLNALYHPVSGGILDDYHNYTTVWTSDALDFYVDGSKVRTLLPADANSTSNYPQTPMRVSVGIWAGGDPTLSEGTREWAGGDTDYTKGPFTMYLKSCQVTDYSSGKEYTYGDQSGSWESIDVAAGNSTVKTALLNKTEAKSSETIAQKWKNLSATAKVAIYASAAGFCALIAAVGIYYCIRQRRIGAAEQRLYEERLVQERTELDQLKKDGINPDSLAASGTEYNARDMREDGLASGNAYNIPPGTPDSVADEKDLAWAAMGAGAVGGGAAIAANASSRGYNNVPLNDPLTSPRLQQQQPSYYNNNSDMGGLRSQTQSPSSSSFAAPTPQRSFTGQSLRNINSASPAPSSYAPHSPTYGNSNQPSSYNGYSSINNNHQQDNLHGSSFSNNNQWR